MFGNDITMCMTETCPKRETCYRYKAEPERLQSYSDFTKLCKSGENYYWPLTVDEDENVGCYNSQFIVS